MRLDKTVKTSLDPAAQIPFMRYALNTPLIVIFKVRFTLRVTFRATISEVVKNKKASLGLRLGLQISEKSARCKGG